MPSIDTLRLMTGYTSALAYSANKRAAEERNTNTAPTPDAPQAPPTRKVNLSACRLCGASGPHVCG